MSEGVYRSGEGAGVLLRTARQQQGLPIDALAASIKVPVAKLEALESGRYDALPDATFTRALAQTVCRALKIDARPVLAQLPAPSSPVLERVDQGLNTPFRDRPGRLVPSDWVPWRHPAAWAVGLLLAAAAGFVLMPGSWVARWAPDASVADMPTVAAQSRQGSEPAGSIASPATVAAAGGTTAQPAAVTATTAPVSPVTAAAVDEHALPAGPSVAVPAAPAVRPPTTDAPDPAVRGARLRASETTWVQATDGRGQVLVSRLLEAGEVVDLDGARPLRLRIGNVRGAELVYQGQRIDIASRARENVATVELP